MAKKRKMKMEFRYYQMQDGIPILALLGEKWVQNYGRDVDYLHFHNYLEIGFCYSGEGELVLGEAPIRFAGRAFLCRSRGKPVYGHRYRHGRSSRVLAGLCSMLIIWS